MSLLQAIALVLGFGLGAVACDLLHGRGSSAWPVGVGVLALAALGGWLYEVHIVAVSLGAGVAWLLVGGVNKFNELVERRRLVRLERERQAAITRRRLEL